MNTPTFLSFCRPVRSILVGCLLAMLTTGLAADEALDTIIARARAYVGSEEALNSLRSIHYKGELLADGGTAGKVDIIFQKPYFQKIVVEVEIVRETTALSGYDGWRKIEDMTNVADWELTLLEAEQIRRLKANTWENLNFYQGGMNSDITVTYEGMVEMDGVSCDKVTFQHSRSIRFVRYFDVDTGRLVMTETEQGGEIREEGEIIISGIRFPERVVTSLGDESSTIVFESVEVNTVYDTELFDVPMLLPNVGG